MHVLITVAWYSTRSWIVLGLHTHTDAAGRLQRAMQTLLYKRASTASNLYRGLNCCTAHVAKATDMLCGHTYSKSMDQPGKVANPTRGQLNKKMNIPCPRSCLGIWSRETGSAVPSRVNLLIPTPRLNLVLTYGIPPEFRGGVHLFILNRHTPSGQSRVIGSRNCVPMAFTAESPPARGQ